MFIEYVLGVCDRIMQQAAEPEPSAHTLNNHADCPDQEALQELAAGIAPPGFMEAHGEHIAKCDRCALLLKGYLSDFADELTADEETILAGLESSTEAGQKRIVARVLDEVRRSRGRAPDAEGSKG